MADAGESQPNSDASSTINTPGVASDPIPVTQPTEASHGEGNSDGENERATRERLKKTSLAGIAQQTKNADDELQPPTSSSSTATNHGEPDIDTAGNGARGRPAKKRSFEDLSRGELEADNDGQGGIDSDQPNPKSGHHKRMRSRDIASSESTVARFGGVGSVASPVQEESDVEAYKSPGGPGVMVDASTATEASSSHHKDTDTAGQGTTAKPTPPSAFANASAISPFGAAATGTPQAAATSNTEAKATSASAFASSGLSAFASSEKSPFGAAAQSSGGFGSKPSSAGFGSSSTGFASSPFATKQSSGGFGGSTGFGSSSGFGAAKPFGGRASGFGGPAATISSFGTGKPFASSKEKDPEETGSDEDDEDNESGQHDGPDEQDERFIAQDVETGEEEEQTIFACRAKLYHFEKEWKERGVGTVKINMREEQVEMSAAIKETTEDEESGRESGTNGTIRRGRLIMRTDGVHRVILNTPIFKSMTIGQADGSEPVGKTMHLTGLEDGKPRAFQIKIGKEEVIKELYWKVIDLRQEAKA